MKTEKRATVYTDVYIANDGKEFTSKDDCMRHEEAVRELCEKSDNVIEAVRALNFRPYGLGADDLWTYRWFFIKNERAGIRRVEGQGRQMGTRQRVRDTGAPREIRLPDDISLAELRHGRF